MDRNLVWQGLTYFQAIYLVNFDVAIDRVISQNSERTDFFCDQEEADSKMFAAYIKFLCDNIGLNRVIIVSPGSLLPKRH